MAASTIDSWISELDQAIAESHGSDESGALFVLRNALAERRDQETFTHYSIHQTSDSIVPLPNWVPKPVAMLAGKRDYLRPVPELIAEAIGNPRDTCNLRGLAVAISKIPFDPVSDISTQQYDISSQASSSKRKRLAELQVQLAQIREQ